MVAESIINKALKYGGIAVAVAVTGFAANHYIKNANADQARSQLDNSPEAQQADHLYSLLRPNANAFFDWFTPIDQPSIVSYASGIADFDKVAKFYKALSKGNDLTDDLRTTLSATQRDQFYKNLAAAKPVVFNSVTIYANQRDAKGNTVSKGFVNAWIDGTNTKPAYSFPNGTAIGKTLKKVTITSGSTKTKAFYVLGTTGLGKGKNFYVLVSQVK